MDMQAPPKKKQPYLMVWDGSSSSAASSSISSSSIDTTSGVPDLPLAVDISSAVPAAALPRTEMTSLVRTKTINSDEVQCPDYLLLKLGRYPLGPLTCI
jgi:hypothetical protein